jgi:hypothetical protein
VLIRASSRVSGRLCGKAQNLPEVWSLPTPADHLHAQKKANFCGGCGMVARGRETGRHLLPSALRPSSSGSSSISSATARRLTWGTGLGSCRYPVLRLPLPGFARRPTEYDMIRVVNAMRPGGCLESDLTTDKEGCNSSLPQFIVTLIPAKRWERHYLDLLWRSRSPSALGL